MTNRSMKLAAAACLLVGSVMGWQAPAFAGSDHSSDTYSGDYQGGSLPIGTFIALQYAGIAHSDAFFDPSGNQVPNSHGNILEEFTRFAYFASLGGHPFVIEAELPFATLTDVNVASTPGLPLPNNAVQGGLVDPVFHLTYFFISDAHIQRWLGLTNYFYLPFGQYDNTKPFNVATARQFTDVPQIGYTEGLGKFSPNLKGVFFDLIANASFHTNGRDPINFANFPSAPTVVTYDSLTQSTSYDVKAFLRYEPSTFTFVSLGIEKSWGGEQIATNGKLSVPGLGVLALLPNQPLLEDDYLRGHLQFQVPLAKDFAIGGDIFHDFQTVGGFREDIGAEIRLTKFFFPEPPPASKGMYTK